MTKQRPDQDQHQWEGFKEVDRAIAENRLTSYSWKKAWADPWGRVGFIAFAILLIAFIIYVVIHDLVL
ncbi:hypothetical protein J121_899 [Qipengyuania citrea LAMA 915]|uniref:Uncharacterized protein n=1 Tax=Qipengyuania citrea LAMA 915 TaxID=1306953 RepID=A0A0L1KFY0_9SPHN|nr:hypothetical protein [Qipengyuania citrea]KNH02935.1 hypothetical protein J121_899 [Qipengyuania citrea LAMA 915]